MTNSLLLPQQTITITVEELINGDISTALEFYEHELKWDTELNFRTVKIDFVEDTKKGTRFLHRNELIDIKASWYQQLLHENPGFLYFLNEEEFNLTLNMLIYQFKPRSLIYLINTKRVNLTEKVRLDSTLKNFLLESIEDLHKYNAAPVELMYKVYNEVAAI